MKIAIDFYGLEGYASSMERMISAVKAKNTYFVREFMNRTTFQRLLSSFMVMAFAIYPTVAAAKSVSEMTLEELQAYLRKDAAPPQVAPPPSEQSAPPAIARRPEDVLTWVSIPGGTFTRRPNHCVEIKSFQMSKAPVTFKQYKACMDTGACTPAHVSDGQCLGYEPSISLDGNLPTSFQGDDQPIVCVDWGQAKVYAEWVGGRLPSEAEWEYAARSAGKDYTYPWGNNDANCNLAVIDPKTGAGPGCGRNATWPVCSKPNGNTEQGLCDMAGNVWVWTQDSWHDSYVGAPSDGSAWEDKARSKRTATVSTTEVPANVQRVIRGGSWDLDFRYTISSFRNNIAGNSLYASLGLRPVRSTVDSSKEGGAHSQRCDVQPGRVQEPSLAELTQQSRCRTLQNILRASGGDSTTAQLWQRYKCSEWVERKNATPAKPHDDQPGQDKGKTPLEIEQGTRCCGLSKLVNSGRIGMNDYLKGSQAYGCGEWLKKHRCDD